MERISDAAHQRCIGDGATDLPLVPQKLCLTASILLRAISRPCRVKARRSNFLRFSKTAQLRGNQCVNAAPYVDLRTEEREIQQLQPVGRMLMFVALNPSRVVP